MDRSNIIYLIGETYTTDEIGQYVPTEIKRAVYCNVRNISRAEWFEAGRSGLQPSYCLTVFEPDYQGEKIVEYEGRRYGVYRTYRTQNETLEIYVEEKGGIADGK